MAPYRRAFLVHKDDDGQLREAILAACTLWGGMRSLIIPVDADGTVHPSWWDLARSLRTSQVVDFTKNFEERKGFTNAPPAPWPVELAHPLDDVRFWHAHPMSAYSTKEQIRTLEMFLPADPSLVGLAGSGHIALPEEVAWWRSSGANICEGADAIQLAKAQISGNTILQATVMHDSDAVLVAPFMQTVGLIWVAAERESFEDALWFWNMRAIRPRGSREGLSLIVTPADLADSDVAARLRTKIAETATSNPDAIVKSASLQKAELVELMSSIGLRSYTESRISERPFAIPSHPDRELTYLFQAHTSHYWGNERSIGPYIEVRMALQRPTSQLRTTSPLCWNPELAGRGTAALRLSAPEIVGPRRQKVANLYHSRATWNNDDLEIAGDIELEYFLFLGYPTSLDILSAACAENDAYFQLNDKGQQVRGILQAGIDPETFRRSETISAVLTLTPDQNRDLVRELRKLRESGVMDQAMADTILQIATINRVSAKTLGQILSHERCLGISPTAMANALDTLVSHRLILRGWQIECDLCSLRDFQELQHTGVVATCPGCGSRARYTSAPSGEPALYYRLSTLLQRVSLNGGLAPLAAIALLLHEGSYIIPGADFRIGDEPQGDLDVLGWQSTMLFAGEAKMSAGGFANQDHQRDAQKSKAIGADVHIAICLQEISANIRDAIEDACHAEGVKPRILDRGQLLLDS